MGSVSDFVEGLYGEISDVVSDGDTRWDDVEKDVFYELSDGSIDYDSPPRPDGKIPLLLEGEDRFHAVFIRSSGSDYPESQLCDRMDKYLEASSSLEGVVSCTGIVYDQEEDEIVDTVRSDFYSEVYP